MISKSIVINSDGCEKCQSGLWIPDLNLFSEDKEILLSESRLNDRLINAAQKLLQAAFPHIPGFQCTLLGQALAMMLSVESLYRSSIMDRGIG